MSYLLDVNILLAYAWQTHQEHRAIRTWFDMQSAYTTCPMAELGFLRVSRTPGFRASLADAQSMLNEITARAGARFIPDDLPARDVGGFASYPEATDAYLVALARSHRLKLATLDERLCAKPWATGVAVNPLSGVGR